MDKRIVKSLAARCFMPDGGEAPSRVYFWTVVSGCLYAGSSFVMLMVTTNVLGAIPGGILALALTLSQQLYSVGAFSMRPYQVSDTVERYSFPCYVTSRFVTCTLALVAGVVWMILGGYSGGKGLAIALLLVVRCSEAFSDVLGGRYQQRGRLDVSGRILAAKTFLATMAFVVVVFSSKSIYPALLAMAATHVSLIFVADSPVLRSVGESRIRLDFHKVLPLLADCLPLAINAYLLAYLNNGPKLAIDRVLDEKSLACYTSLSMVSFVVALFSDFIVSPQVVPLSRAYHEKRFGHFARSLARQIPVIMAFALLGIGGAWLVGAPVLSYVFGLDLLPYRAELCILLAGGLFLALYQVCQLVLIVLRKQAWGLCGMVAAAAVVLWGAKPMVSAYGIRGGAYCYLLSMFLLFVIVFAVSAIQFLFSRRRAR